MNTVASYVNSSAREWRADVDLADPRRFHTTLPGYAPTPLRDLPALAAELGVARLLVKQESARLGLPAFKILGASYAVHRALESGRPAGLVTATDGNHGRALARTGRLVGLPVRVHIAAGVHPGAVAAIAAEGATVIEDGHDYDGAVAGARADAEVRGWLLVQDMAWLGYEQIPGWIVQGYTTLFWEIDEHVAGLPPVDAGTAMGAAGTLRTGAGPSVDAVVVPVGVGSLAEAALRHYRRPSLSAGAAPAVLSVEPESAACVLASVAAGRLTSVPTGVTAMAGLNCGTPSASAWPVLQSGLDAAVAVSEDECARAVADLNGHDVDAGPCGAATLAGLRRVAADIGLSTLGLGPDATVVLVSTEGTAANPYAAQGMP